MRGAWCVVFAAALTIPDAAWAWEPPKVPGFKGPVDLERFDPQSVWQAIDGAAELYVAYGFKQLTSVEYQRKDLLLAVGVFEQASPLDAYGVFLKQPQKDAKPLPFGAAAFVSAPTQCVLVKGVFYVKADAARGSVTQDVCMEFLPAFAKVLPGDAAVPKELALLPRKGQAAGSLGYSKTSFLGLSDLKNVVHAKYDDGGKSFQLFLLLGGVDGLSAKWKPLANPSVKGLTRTIPYQGDVVVATLPKGTFGILGIKDTADALAILKAVGE